MAERGDIRIGVSGWTYAPWRGQFFPKGLPQRQELAYAARRFNSIEINGSFYGLQVPKTFARWAEAVPDDFVFAVKGSRFITHVKRATDAEAPLANFLASGLFALGHKLGPMLWQFPPSFRFDAEQIEGFLKLLPHDREAAEALARRHDGRLRAAPLVTLNGVSRLRHAMEVRHESFRDPAFIALLRRYRVALVVADTVTWPLLMDATADFIYCRLHGSGELYRSNYDDAALGRWADRIRAWASGQTMTDGNFVTAPVDDGKRRDVHVYFDNTDKLRAPDNAHTLMQKLGLGIAPARMPDEAPAGG